VVAVNIDNGFGAGFFAALVTRRDGRRTECDAQRQEEAG
jgi:NCAIR mutase (PurE)-related protein